MTASINMINIRSNKGHTRITVMFGVALFLSFIVAMLVAGTPSDANFNNYGSNSCLNAACHGATDISGNVGFAVYVALDQVETSTVAVNTDGSLDTFEVDFFTDNAHGTGDTSLNYILEMPDPTWSVSKGTTTDPAGLGGVWASWSDNWDQGDVTTSDWARMFTGATDLKWRDQQWIIEAVDGDAFATKTGTFCTDGDVASGGDKCDDDAALGDGSAQYHGSDAIINVPANFPTGSYTVYLISIGHQDGGTKGFYNTPITVNVIGPSVSDTTTLGDGSDPTGITNAPGTNNKTSQFTFVTNNAGDAVNQLEVTTTGDTGEIANVQIFTTGGAQRYNDCTGGPTWTCSGGTTITATAAPTTYFVNTTWKGHATLSAATNYTTTTQVTSFTPASYGTGGSDAAGNTFTVDNTPPANPTGFTGSAGDANVDFAGWSNPGDADFDVIMVVNSATGAVSASPTEGATYVVGNTFGTDTVKVYSTATTFNDNPLENGTAMNYKIFARDTYGNWSAGATDGPLTPVAAAITTLGDGSDPVASTDAPGTAVTTSQFTFVTSVGTDTITDLTVATTGDTGEIASVQIWDSTGSTTQYFNDCTIGGAGTCTLGTSIPVTTTPTTYTIVTTWKSHAAMSAAGTYTTTTEVTAFSSTNAQGDTETVGNTFTGDNTPPAAIGDFSGSAGVGSVSLGVWTNPGGDFAQVIIINSASGATSGNPVDGSTYIVGNTFGSDTVIYVGSGTSTTDTPLENGTAMNYEIFARDTYNNWSVGATAGPYTPTAAPVIDNLTTTGRTVVAASASEGDVDVQMEYIQLDCDGAGDNSIEITSVTVDDLQIAATTGIVDNLEVYMGPDTVWANRYSGNGIQGTWNGDSQSIDITSIAQGDRTIVCTTPKYAWIVYDLNASSAPNAIQSRVTDVGVAGTDNGLTGLTYDSNNLTIAAVPGYDSMSVANSFTNATSASSGATGVLMQRLELQCTAISGGGDNQCVIDSITVDDTVVSATGTVDTVTASLSSNADCSSPFNTANTASWNGQSTIISFGGGATSRDVLVGSNEFLCITYDINAAGSGNVRSSVTVIAVNADGTSDTSPSGAPWNSSTIAIGLSQQFNIIDCNDCHGVQDDTWAPVDSATRNSPEGAVTGKHAKGSSHVPTGEASSECEVCHGSDVGSYGTNHQTGVINMSSDIRGGYYDKDDDTVKDTAGFPSDIAFNMSSTPTTATCRNVYCHGDAGSQTPQWGAGVLPCNSCHEATQALSAKHSFHYNSASVATSRNATNDSTTGNYKFNCGVCHDVDPVGEHVDNSNFGAIVGNGFTVDIKFNLTDWSPPATTPAYSNNGGATAVGNFTYWSDGQCSNIYCHSNGQTVPTYQTPSWSDGALGCGGCHGAPDVNAGATTLVGWHGSHMGDDVYNFGCGECHAGTVADDTDGPITGFDYHVNGIENVVFATVGPKDQSLGIRDTGNDWCTNLYCHSDGKDSFTPVANTPTWFGSDNTSCTSCHDDNVSTALSAPHAKHVQADPDQNYTCDNCHSLTVANNQTATLAGYTVHVDGIQNVVFSATGFSTNHRSFVADGAGYNGAQCSNVYCHSDVQSSNGTAGPGSYTALNWASGAQSCTTGDCHNGKTGSVMATGSHTPHLSEGYDCVDCHRAGGSGNIGNHVDGYITVIFNTTYGGSYSQGAESVPENDYGSCSTNYCHSSGQAVTDGGSTPVYNSPTWNDTPSAACGECHRGRTGDAKTMNSGSHTPHLSYGGVSVECADCHDGLGSGTASHVDQNINLSFLAANAGGTAGYSQGTTHAVGNNYGSCSNIYCHGEFTGGNTGNDPTWNNTAVCGTCHNATPTTNAHTTHLGLASVNLTCLDCHGHNGSSTHITMTANGVLNTAAWYFSASSTYDSQTVTWASGKADSGSVATCGNVACHSTVQNQTNGDSTGIVYATPDWDKIPIVQCGSCHKADGSQGDNSTMDSGTHTKHLSSGYACDDCHAYGGQSLIANHVDNGIDVGNATNIGSYNQDGNAPGNNYGTCSSIACHGGNNANWGGAALNCDDCHGGASDVDDYVYNNGTTAKIDTTTDWDTTGHGRTTGDGPLACTTCHDSGSAHGSAINPFRLKTSSDSDINAIDGFNDICYACHGTGQDTVDSMTSSLKVDKYHFGGLHSGTDAGRFCWDCHDPHGDDNAKMIHDYVPLDSTATYGVPIGALVGFPIDFDGTAGSGGSGSGAWARSSGNYTEGLCNVCHRSGTNNYTFNSYDGSHTTTDCTACHVHSKDTTVDGDAWKGAGSCTGCHGTAQGSRRQILGGTAGNPGDDFIRASRHVTDGTATEIVTDQDCIICHMEGDESAGDGSPNSTYHTQSPGPVHLRDVDSTDGATEAVAWLPASVDTTMRDGMDSFCMGCHDSGGATEINVGTGDVVVVGGGGSSQPFAPFNSSDTGGAPANVRDMFNSGNLVGRNYASHHNLNQFELRYDAAYQTANSTRGAWTGTVLEGGTPGWNSGLHCADCHLNESNAHGSRNTLSLLQDSSGNDATYDESTDGTGTFVCYKCHDSTAYNDGASDTRTRFDHDFDSNAWNKYTAPRQIICIACHGGQTYVGAIHGKNDTYTTLNFGDTKSYRFLPGAGLRLDISEANWETSVQPSCYTENSSAYTGLSTNCSQHEGTGNNSRIMTPRYSRDLD